MRVFVLVLAFICAEAFAEPYPIKVQGTRQGSGAVVRAHNDGAIPISVVVTFTEFENLNTSEAVPIVAVVPPNSVLDLTRLTPLDTRKGWGYKLRYRSRYGPYTAAHDPDALSRMPWLDGRSFVIGQAPGGKIVTHFSPASRNAVDIPMPEGTPILAARAGIA